MAWTYDDAKAWLERVGGRIERDRRPGGERVRVRVGSIAAERRTIDGFDVTDVEIEAAVAELAEEVCRKLPPDPRRG